MTFYVSFLFRITNIYNFTQKLHFCFTQTLITPAYNVDNEKTPSAARMAFVLFISLR